MEFENGTEKLKGEKKQLEEEIQEVVAGLDGADGLVGLMVTIFGKKHNHTILGILVVYLIVAKGDVMLAVVFNPLLFALRGTRAGFTFLTSKISNMIHPGGENTDTPQEEMTRNVSPKNELWGNGEAVASVSGDPFFFKIPKELLCMLDFCRNIGIC